MNMELCPIILCGGVGKRLWPISTKNTPKQFVQSFNGLSLFQKTLLRVSSSFFLEPIIISSNSYAHIIKQQADEVKQQYILLEEPSPRNTSPSIMLAIQYCLIKDIENCVILPSDQLIPDEKYFLRSMKEALTDIHKHPLTIFGVKPISSSSDYGYIKVRKTEKKSYSVEKFIEKPNVRLSKILSNRINYLWNCGIFMFTTKILSQYLSDHKHTTYIKSKKILQDGINVDEMVWSKLKKISFDNDVIETMQNIRCFKYDSKWQDLGSIPSFLKEADLPKDDLKSNMIINSKNINMYNNSHSNIVVSDLSDIDIIYHEDNLLIKKSKKNNNELFEKINKLDIQNNYKKVIRPWGWFKTLSISDNYHVKEICVKAHNKLSLQTHKKRRENWLVLQGTATVIREKEKYLLKKNESIQIDINQKHRLENNTSKDIFLIEIQTGTYFGEDDIIRYTNIQND